MTWIPIHRRTARSYPGEIVLKVARKPASGDAAFTFLFSEQVLRRAGLAIGDDILLFRGEDEHAARLALRKAARHPDSFRLSRQGRRARVVLDALACGGLVPDVEGSYPIDYEIAGDLLQLILPARRTDAPPDRAQPGPATPLPDPAHAGSGADDGSVRPPPDGIADRMPARHGGPWTEMDDARLRQMREQGAPTEAIAQALGRSRAAIYLRASQLRLPRVQRSAAAGSPEAAPAGAVAAVKEIRSIVVQAAAWLRQQGATVETAAAGMYKIDGETVTALRLIQIANDRRARQARPLPPLPLPSPDEVRRA